MTPSNGARVESIWLKTERRGPMASVDRATLVEGIGIEGNANRGGYRQVTLLDADAWEAATAELGVDVDPASRRANVLVRGVALTETGGRVLRVGGSRIQIRGETLPCDLMEEAAPGLREALKPSWRAGAYGVVLTGGPVAIGDAVEWES
ncbi:MAG: MOSC domain-containing protein [Gemmatimonadetes bacterium]|nr:MOSC domain-containing protein [Gemmatimonadota bacterium]